MKTLKDYDLQRGDWVRCGVVWHEVSDCTEHYVSFYDVIDSVPLDKKMMLAVLRPSVIIRDKLDDSLEHVRSGEPYTSTDQWNVSLKEIHPKERKKSLKEKCSLNYPMDALDVFNTFHLL